MLKAGPEWRGEERRFFVRIPCKLNVSFRLGAGQEGAGEGYTENVSIGGVEFISPVELAAGAQLEASIGSPSEGILVRVPTLVRHCARLADREGYHVAVEFSGPVESAGQAVLQLAPPHIRAMEGRPNRQFVRVNCKVPVWFRRTLLSRIRRGWTVNLGVGGMMFATEARVCLDDRLRLTFSLPDGPGCGPGLRLGARVVNVQRQQGSPVLLVSAVFVSSPPGAEEEIGRYVAQEARAGRSLQA